MFKKMVPVSLERHQQKKVRSTVGFSYASDFHIAYVTMHEFARASAVYPIVFLEEPTLKGFRPVVLMGLESGENLFVGQHGSWSASYIPAMIRRYPFALSKGEQEGRFVVCLDEESPLLSETEGAALFDDKGQPTQVIENVKRYLSELQQMDFVTQEFVKFLQSHKLLTSLSMRVNTASQVKNITGCYVINEEELDKLGDEVFKQLREKKYLPAVYAHLLSMPQIERLIQLKNERARGSASPKT